MDKKLSHGDQYNTQYSHISSIIYNAPGGKKLAIKPAFHKQHIRSPLAHHLNSKMTISSIPSIYSKKVDDVDLGFGSSQNQIAFIRKVYFAVLLQSLLVVSLQCVTKFDKSFEKCCEEPTSSKKYNKYCKWIPLSSTIFTLIILACCEFHRRHPYNYIALTYFTCSASVYLMYVSLSIDMIFNTMVIFAASIIGLTLFTCQTKFKYTIYTGLGTVLICDIIVFIILFFADREKWNSHLYSELLASIFLMFFVIDIQIMISGNHKYEIRENEFVFATMTLYTDVVNLFIYVLQLLNSAKD